MSAPDRRAGRVRAAATAAAACALLATMLTVPAASGFAFLNGRWPDRSITMHLQLGASSRLSDGSESWGQSAESALAAWNQTITTLQFQIVRDSTASRGDGNGVNNVFFGNDIYGMAFDDGVVAVTTSWLRRSSRTEADVIFNGARAWDSYDGSLKRSAMDFHRVALHEFGHVLGLDHPDEHGQALSAIMNSHISDLDRMTRDDIGGAQGLYGATAGEPMPTSSTGLSVGFPPPDESLHFRQQLEVKYREGLGRGSNATSVDTEGDVVWTQEYVRYRVNQCTHAQALDRVSAQIAGGAPQSVCGNVPNGQVLFPPRNDAVQFRIALEAIYRDTLGRTPITTSVDQEGDVVWLQEYLRYRVNGCGHGVAVQSVFVQIDGAPPPAVCR
jgi:Matrixin